MRSFKHNLYPYQIRLYMMFMIISKKVYLNLPFKGVEGISERGTPREVKECFNCWHDGGGGMLCNRVM